MTNYKINESFNLLARCIFECENGGDPWGLSNNIDFETLANQPGQAKEALNTLVDVAIWKFKYSEDMLHQLLITRKEIATMATAEDEAAIVSSLNFLMMESVA